MLIGALAAADSVLLLGPVNKTKMSRFSSYMLLRNNKKSPLSDSTALSGVNDFLRGGGVGSPVVVVSEEGLVLENRTMCITIAETFFIPKKNERACA